MNIPIFESTYLIVNFDQLNKIQCANTDYQIPAIVPSYCLRKYEHRNLARREKSSLREERLSTDTCVAINSSGKKSEGRTIESGGAT